MQRQQFHAVCGAAFSRSRKADRQLEDKRRNVIETIPATLLFALIGATPHTDWLADVLQRDPKGFIVTGHDVDLSAWPLQRKPMSFETSVPGIFAVGDVCLGSTKRVASAVGEGAGAVENVHRYLNEAVQAATDMEERSFAAGIITASSPRTARSPLSRGRPLIASALAGRLSAFTVGS